MSIIGPFLRNLVKAFCNNCSDLDITGIAQWIFAGSFKSDIYMLEKTNLPYG